jgi:glucans biosynthesis protein C
LLIYYVAMLPVAAWGRSSRRCSSWFRGLMSSAWRPVPLAALTAVPLLASPIGVIPTPRSFWPEPISLAAHGVFFAFGWAIFGHADLLSTFARHSARQLAVAVGLVPVAGLALLYRCRAMPPDWFGPLPPGAESSALLRPPDGLWLPPANSPALAMALQLAVAMIGSLIVWLSVFGVTGLFVRHLDRPIAWMRYLAGASYWIYLAHFPLMIWVPIAIAGVDLPALVKLVFVLTVSLTLLLIVYQGGVRGTAVGPCLDWRRVARKGIATRSGLTPWSFKVATVPEAEARVCSSRTNVSNPCP